MGNRPLMHVEYWVFIIQQDCVLQTVFYPTAADTRTSSCTCQVIAILGFLGIVVVKKNSSLPKSQAHSLFVSSVVLLLLVLK